METEVKVFHSEISRVDCDKENHLYDLLKVEPAKPISRSPCTKNENWEFKPKEKLYLPKRVQSKLKVKTVSEVRALFEKDVYTYLASDLELQQNYLLRKICDGSSSDDKTRKTAMTLLNGDKPISRSSWHMLSNINPQRHKHTKQFVLWNGRCIQVNGTKGGKHKFICNYDLKNEFKKSSKDKSQLKKSLSGSRIGLLRNSLSVKFKPGPLGKKKLLDASHHKYQMGDVELVKLPAPVLEVSPAYGTVLEPTISSFVNNLRGEKGVISQKLAEFAVSVLGTIAHNNTATQHEENSSITFDLIYKCGQNRILMRRNSVKTIPHNMHNDHYSNSKTKQETKSIQTFYNEGSCMRSDAIFRAIEGDNISLANNDDSIFEIKQIISEMLDSVCISLNQDNMYSGENEPRDTIADEGRDLVCSKDKNKRKYCELDKLDVTIIKLAESPRNDEIKRCEKSFCAMGCVCESLDGTFSLKQHCGILDCMFGCKCEVSKYKDIEFLEQDCGNLIPGLLNLDNQLNSHMAKEEQKFHQTIILTGDKSILLKSRKRNCKSSKRYEEFYSKKNVKVDEKIKRVLTLDIEKVSCENIEPLCMVHNLYKCFCKLKFTESYVRNEVGVNTNRTFGNEVNKGQIEVDLDKILDKQCTKDNAENSTRSILRSGLRNTSTRSECLRKHSSNTEDDADISVACARTVGYHGRKYTVEYYSATNKKIIEMEENDSVLRNKMLRLINGKNNSTSETISTSSDSLDCDTIANETLEVKNCEDRLSRLRHSNVGGKQRNEIGGNDSDILIETANNSLRYCVDDVNDPQPVLSPDNKASLKKWLETSYKSYKERLGKGIVKNCLEAPKKGKAALQSWDFILSRYRERKNIFVVSKQPPFRTFLAVDNKHPFMANCINIDDIRFADLPKYPIIIRNLVTDATDSENSFCILRGWDHCWELIGAAVKVIEQTHGSEQEMNFLSTDNIMRKDCSSDDGNDSDRCSDKTYDLVVPETVPAGKESGEIDQDASEKSKWFVLTVEDDFTEIQFYKKGFFVTYEGIQRSITLARISGKTVRLSSRARIDKIQNTAQPYGVYAIPCTAQSCVFIGPYEEHEPLGIEVVKSVLDSTRLKKTRGVWIKTNKVDDKNVIDNPLAYLPSASVQIGNIPVAEIDITADTTPTVQKLYEQGESSTTNKPVKKPKNIKPIKIRRTNGFYQLSSQNIWQKTSNSLLLNGVKESLLKPVDIKESHPSVANFQPVMVVEPQKNLMEKCKPSTSLAPYTHIGVKPVAEIAPQIKITNVYSEKITRDTPIKDKGSMFILNPEEINQKVLGNSIVNNNEGATDVEKFLESCTICIAPQEEVLLISDGEEDIPTSNDIWIQCSNIENFGYIRAKLNDDDTKISFEFPGFKYSEFYERNEAFEKINQVLARKMFVPKNVKLQWQVVREKQHLTCDMLTPNCLEDKKYLLNKVWLQKESLQKALKTMTPEDSSVALLEVPKKDNVVTYVNKKKKKPSSVNLDSMPKNKTEQMKLIEGLEEASRQLEQQSAVLWKEAVTRRDEIFSSLSVPNNLKLTMTGTLEDIMSMNDQ